MKISSQKEVSNLKKLNENMFYFDVPEQLLKKIDEVVMKTDVVADIGCGIAPMNYFEPKLHFLIDPWKEYTDILSLHYANDSSVIVLRATALEALRTFGDKSVDSIFLLDVIEHMEKNEGIEVIKEAERVARQQIVIFTPLGFMSQELELDEKDGWGLSGAVVQTHKSGWIPEDFSSDWLLYICDTFHTADHKNKPLDKPHGAFFAIQNIEGHIVENVKSVPKLWRPRKTENELALLKLEMENLKGLNYYLQTSLEGFQKECHITRHFFKR